jgi:hypothetical protein
VISARRDQPESASIAGWTIHFTNLDAICVR